MSKPIADLTFDDTSLIWLVFLGKRPKIVTSFCKRDTENNCSNSNHMAKSYKQPADGPQHRIFLVEDHPVFRDGLAKLLNAEADLTVCGEAGDAKTGLKN